MSEAKPFVNGIGADLTVLLAHLSEAPGAARITGMTPLADTVTMALM